MRTDLCGAGLAELALQAAHGRVGVWAASGISTDSRLGPPHLPASAAGVGVAIVSLGAGMLEAVCSGVGGELLLLSSSLSFGADKEEQRL